MQTICYVFCPHCGSKICGDTRDELKTNLMEHIYPLFVSHGHADAASRDLVSIFATLPEEPSATKPPPELIPPAKPPLGIEPESIWHETRMLDLIDCISRYRTAGLPIKDEWMAELRNLLDRHFTVT